MVVRYNPNLIISIVSSKEDEMTKRPDSEPRVSVIIPYSPDHTPTDLLKTATVSAESQSVKTELIVINDTDQQGPSWARNRGLNQVETRYAAFLDADDSWHDNKLSRQLAAMGNTGAGMCVEAKDTSPAEFLRELYLGNISSITSSVLIDTTQVNLRFEEELERREDHLFALEAAIQAGVCFVDNCFTVGGHEGSLSQGTSTRYRLKQDYHFSRYVWKRVPRVRESLQFYERPRCDHGFTNTPGDLYRCILLWPSLLSVIGIMISLICQRVGADLRVKN